MIILKQLDKLVTKSFLGPYIIAFVVAEFVLVLQFIWRYIDDFIGRGISPLIISEMVFYYAITIIPLAVPISILISSVMVYGNMAEKYELTSFKSAGVSLYRIMRPGIIIAVLTGLFSIFSSNFLKPKANLSFYQTFDNVRRAKPTMTIDQGIFNYDFKGYAIRVGKKLPDGKQIEDVLIYDQTDRRLLGLITARTGQMYISDDGRYFTMELNDGVQYSEMERKNDRGRRDQNQFVRVYFEKFVKKFDMSEFEFSLTENNLGRRKHDLYNTFQMKAAIDSIDLKMLDRVDAIRYSYGGLLLDDLSESDASDDEDLEEDDVDEEGNAESLQESKVLQSNMSAEDAKNEAIRNMYKEQYGGEGAKAKDKTNNNSTKSTIRKDVPSSKAEILKKASIQSMASKRRNSNQKADRYYRERVSFRLDTFNIDTLSSLVYTISPAKRRNITFRAKSACQTVKERYRTLAATTKSSIYSRNRFQLRMHQQLCWAAICVIFLFIGAPLGSIVRKGGFGYPLLIAITFFVIFVFTNIMGEKLVNNGTFDPIFGAWLPCIILTPFAIYFTLKAIRDSRFNFSFRS